MASEREQDARRLEAAGYVCEAFQLRHSAPTGFQPGQRVRCSVEPKHYDDVPYGAEGEILRVAGDGRYVVMFGPFQSLWTAGELEAA